MTSIGQVSGVENHRRVMMMQLRHRPRFAQETIGNVGVAGEFAFDDLDCYGAFESEVGGKVNGAHAAGPNFTFNPESASDELGDIHIDLPCRVKRPDHASSFYLGWGK